MGECSGMGMLPKGPLTRLYSSWTCNTNASVGKCGQVLRDGNVATGAVGAIVQQLNLRYGTQGVGKYE